MSLPGAARALGLGDIRIDSGLNEPLSAQIDIVGATRDELIGLTAKVANRDVFLHAGSERPLFLTSATFKVGLDARGRPVLNVRSVEPFTDPVVSFFVDLRWNTGELIREYSLLLDPAGYSPPHRAESVAATSEPNASTGPAVASASTPAPVTATTAVATTAPPAAAAGTAQANAAQHAEPTHHQVGRKDTLRAIVRAAGARSETAAQRMMIAIYRANPHAFDGNINLLRSGVVIDLPTPAQIDAVDALDAKREVRAQMTAWRLDGRPARARRFAAQSQQPPQPATAPGVEPAVLTLSAPATASRQPLPPDQAVALQNRVQSLEAELDDMHKQLVSEHASIQDLKDRATNKPVAMTTPASEPSAPVPQPLGTPRVEVMHEPVSSTTDSSGAAAVSSSAVADSPAAPVSATAPGTIGRVAGWLAAALLLVSAGIAYVRRLRLRAQFDRLPDAADDVAPLRPIAATSATLTATATSATDPARPDDRQASELPVEGSRAIPIAARPTGSTGTHPAAPEGADREALEQALERSYLDALAIDSLGIDTEVNGALRNGNGSGPHESAGLETVALDGADLAAAEDQASINTAIMEGRHIEASMPPVAGPVATTAVDYDLLDLDSTAEHVQHVQMPSQLHEHIVMGERRTNIVDVLKSAIERDPNRRDLRMKLLETYHGTAATNRRAFLDVVKKLAREQDKLSPEDWKKVVMMGREIAGDDIFFADPSKDDLANCA